MSLPSTLALFAGALSFGAAIMRWSDMPPAPRRGRRHFWRRFLGGRIHEHEPRIGDWVEQLRPLDLVRAAELVRKQMDGDRTRDTKTIARALAAWSLLTRGL